MLITALHRLEYRGYDSAGVSLTGCTPQTVVLKKVGNVGVLEKAALADNVAGLDLAATSSMAAGIAHTRWATHGEPCDRNAHPHSSDPQNEFTLVHNGIMTNFSTMKQLLQGKGFTFLSDTDTEVIAGLAKYLYDTQVASGKPPTFAHLVMEVMQLTEGAYAMVFQSLHFPGELVACKRGSPMIVAVRRKEGEGEFRREDSAATVPSDQPAEFFFASDSSAIIEHCRDVVYLQDDDVAVVKSGRLHIYNRARNSDFKKLLPELREIHSVEVALEGLHKGSYNHYMQKEIFEQPESLVNSMRGRINYETLRISLGGFNNKMHIMRNASRLLFISCGTSLNACLAVRPMFDELSGTAVAVENASDFLDRSPYVSRNDVCIFVSQSGETADTLRALEYCQEKGATVVGFCNTVGSSISRQTHFGAHLNCGLEIGVASTKAYTSQIVTMSLVALMMCSDSIRLTARRETVARALTSISRDVADVLRTTDQQMALLAQKLKNAKSVLILARGYQYATCLEGALKIKELTYVHTEGINLGELKHGPLALIDETMPIIVIATRDSLIDRARAAVQQIRARQGKPIVMLSEPDAELEPLCEEVIRVPQTVDCLQCIVNVVPLQLLAYHLAVARGNNVDCPRNLAKSVTVQ